MNGDMNTPCGDIPTPVKLVGNTNGPPVVSFGDANTGPFIGETSTGPGAVGDSHTTPCVGDISHPVLEAGNMGAGPFVGDVDSPGVLCGVLDTSPAVGQMGNPFGPSSTPPCVGGIPQTGMMLFGVIGTGPFVSDINQP